MLLLIIAAGKANAFQETAEIAKDSIDQVMQIKN